MNAVSIPDGRRSRMHGRSARARGGLALAVMLFAEGCEGPSPSASSNEPIPSQDEDLQALLDSLGPADWLFKNPLTPEQARAARALVDLEIKECMSLAGFTYNVDRERTGTWPPDASGTEDERLLALYGRQELAPGESAIPPEERGCFGQSELSVYGRRPADFSEIAAELDKYYASLDIDAEFQGALDAWARCVQVTAGPFELVPGFVLDGPEDLETYVSFVKDIKGGLELLAFEGEENMPLQTGEIDPSQFQGAILDDSGYGIARVGTRRTLTAQQDADLAALRSTLHATDLSCRESSGLADIVSAGQAAFTARVVAEYPHIFG